ncbi:hypothetical protein FQN55_002192 [Onygenales sp. PD_40]|nr:hypothetical protein FQN55_002192 [Onygenales sp. PD_40]
MTANLEIIDAIRAGDNHSAQLVTVLVKQVSPQNTLPTDTKLPAKIYDPLYYDHEQDDADPFLCVDRDYSQETAVYRSLPNLYGTIIPRYFGSFTLKLPVDSKTTRSVRLILMEIVPGTSMQQLKPTDFSQLQRQAIMKAVIDAETLLYTYNISHGDRHPRNTLVVNAAEASNRRRVVIIDFGRSSIGRTPFLEEEERYLPGVEISPLLRWNEAWGFWHAFDEWIDWDWQAWLEDNYAGTRDSITDHMRSNAWNRHGSDQDDTTGPTDTESDSDTEKRFRNTINGCKSTTPAECPKEDGRRVNILMKKDITEALEIYSQKKFLRFLGSDSIKRVWKELYGNYIYSSQQQHPSPDFEQFTATDQLARFKKCWSARTKEGIFLNKSVPDFKMDIILCRIATLVPVFAPSYCERRYHDDKALDTATASTQGRRNVVLRSNKAASGDIKEGNTFSSEISSSQPFKKEPDSKQRPSCRLKPIEASEGDLVEFCLVSDGVARPPSDDEFRTLKDSFPTSNSVRGLGPLLDFITSEENCLGFGFGRQRGRKMALSYYDATRHVNDEIFTAAIDYFEKQLEVSITSLSHI